MLPDTHNSGAIPAEARTELDRLFETGDLFRYTAAEGAPVTLLEREFAEMMGARYALAVSSCSAALFLALKALDLPRGARVLIPGFTFAAVPSSVVHADCVPVLCEVGTDYRVDMADFEAKLDGVAAVLISHMRGHTSDMDAIRAACAARDLPLVEDAAHSLGTLWNGEKIGTLGRVGCFSFQSYKMVNAGEGGIMISDDADLIARAVIMSGAYEENWRKHDGLAEAMPRWQNKLPLYNLRLSNLAAAVIRPQLPLLAERIAAGRRNHDALAAQLSTAPEISVPSPLPGEERAPDSIQFNLPGLTEAQRRAFAEAAAARGVKVQIFGMSRHNARAFWNWEFLGALPELPQTRAMLMMACDVRLPVWLSQAQVAAIGAVLLDALEEVRQAAAA